MVDALLQSVLKAGPARLFAAFGLLAMAAAVLFALFGFMGREEKALLFSEIDAAEAGQIVDRLDQASIPYDLRGDGTAIYVPRSKVASARLMLAGDGLPSRGSIGYELFDRTDALGATQFMQNLNRVRALEGELARTIVSLDGVAGARVHLVLPERQLFERDRQEPSASIVLKLSGAPLNAEQVRAVRNLVSGATPGLPPERVTILDERGRLLAAGDEAAEAAGGVGDADERRRAVEERIRSTVLDIVEGVVGPGRARVQVTAEMDFNRITEASERFDPDGRVVRSTSSSEEKTSSSESVGGAASASGNVPDGTDTEGAGADGEASERSEETVNYEISKTTRTEVIEGGRVKRLSVAVAVDGVAGAPAEGGGDSPWAPRDPAELERITALVRSAVGYDAERGDTVEVVNVRFAQPETQGTEATKPSPFDPSKIEPMRVAELAAALIAALALIIFVVRPLIKGLLGQAAPALPPPAPAAALAAAGAPALAAPERDPFAEAGVDIAQFNGSVRASSVRKVAEVVQANPDQSVTILRDWLSTGT